MNVMKTANKAGHGISVVFVTLIPQARRKS
jgi:hypothetical protein